MLCILNGWYVYTSDVLQFASDKTGEELDYYNWRSRGFLSWKGGRPTVVFAEEDVLEYEGGMQIESILIHEFAHVIHGAGFDEELQDRLTKTYKEAKAKGVWNDGRAAQRFRRVKSKKPVRLLDALVKWFPDESRELIRKCLDGGDILVNGEASNSKVKVTCEDKVLIVFGGEKECYAGKNRAEYWAEGVQNWYDTNRTMDHDHNHIHTREQLKEYDTGLAKMCEDVLGDSKWRFVSPRERAGKGHLKGFDPATAPKVVDPDHIKKAANDYYDKYWKDYWGRLGDKHGTSAVAKKDSASNAIEEARKHRFEPVVQKIEGWTVHVDPQLVKGEHSESGAEALKMLGNHLQRIAILVPEEQLAKLRTVEFWIERRHPQLGGMQYHPGRKWLTDKGYDRRLTKKVHITRADQLLSRGQMLKHPAVILHELAHGYHDQILSFDNRRIIAAYDKAMAAGLYDKALLYTGREVRHYGASNHKEYFAEGTEAFFYRNDFYPFVAAELERHDPTLFNLLVEIWGSLK